MKASRSAVLDNLLRHVACLFHKLVDRQDKNQRDLRSDLVRQFRIESVQANGAQFRQKYRFQSEPAVGFEPTAS